MKIHGKLSYDGLRDGVEVFIFRGYNPTNGEPWMPILLSLQADSPSVPMMKEECLKETAVLTVPDEPLERWVIGKDGIEPSERAA